MRSREEMVSLVIKRAAVFCLPSVLLAVVGLFGCKTAPPPDPQSQLIAKGSDMFFNDTLAGNRRTGGTLHPAESNFTIDAAFIPTLPKDSPLLFARFNPSL